MGMLSILQNGTTPAGEVARLLAFGHFQGLLEGVLEVGLNFFAFEPSTQKISPQEFAEWRRVLGKSARTSQFARERAERVVDELIYRLRQVAVRPPTGIHKGMCPIAIVHDKPEGVVIERA